VYKGELQHGLDIDVYSFHVAAPGTFMRISVDAGASPMAAAFRVLGPLSKPYFVRQGSNPGSGSVSREVFLPLAGAYLVAVFDQRAFRGSPPAVTPGTFCYTLRLETLPQPTPIDLGGGRTHFVTAEGKLGFFRFTIPPFDPNP